MRPPFLETSLILQSLHVSLPIPSEIILKWFSTEWKWAWRTDKSIMSAGGNPLSISPQSFSMIPLGFPTTDAARDHGKMGFTCPPRHIQINAPLSNGKIWFVLLDVPIIQMFTDYLHLVAYITTWSNRFSTLLIMLFLTTLAPSTCAPAQRLCIYFLKHQGQNQKRKEVIIASLSEFSDSLSRMPLKSIPG